MFRRLVQIFTGGSDDSSASALPSFSDEGTRSLALLSGSHGNGRDGRIASDRPISGISGDLFGISESFIPRLVRIAVEWAGDEGFVIGMYGSWGVGKTSAMNMLSDYVGQNEKEFRNVYVCQFNPWFYEDTRTLITSFFATLAAELGKDTRKPWARAATALRAMGGFLAVASRGVSMFGFGLNTGVFPEAARVANEALKETSAFSGEVGGFVDLVLGGQRKLEEHRAEVEKALRQLGQSGGRIVVLVDDVDRLSRNELIALLRLVRVVADLPRISIILAVDDERIRDVLEHIVSEGYGKAYLDKIIQVGIHVPVPSREVIQEMLLKELEAAFAARGIDFPEDLRPSETLAHRGPLEAVLECIRTPRDLARYRNAVSVLVLSGDDTPDIHPTDAALIEALHVFYPHVYDGVRRRRRFLTHRLTSEQYQSRGRNVAEVRRQRHDELELIIHGGTESSLDRLNQRTVRTLLHHLFGEIVDPAKVSLDTNESILRRIRSNLAFDNYFRFANTSLVPRAVVNELLDDLIALSEVETSEQLAERIATYLGGRDRAAVTRVIEDLGFLLKRVSEDEIRRMTTAGIAALPSLPASIRVPLVTMLLDSYVHVRNQRRGTLFDREDRVDDGAVYWFLHALITRELSFADSVVLLGRERCEAWGANERRVELLDLWLKLLQTDVAESRLDWPEDRERLAEVFTAARTAVSELGEAAPLLEADLSEHLSSLVRAHPELLPNALHLASCRTCGKHILVCEHQGISDALQKLRSTFGDFTPLRTSLEALQTVAAPIGTVKHALDQFEELLDITSAPIRN